MWLPKIEREVLVYFYKRTQRLGDWVDFDPRPAEANPYMEGLNCLAQRGLLDRGVNLVRDGKQTGLWSVCLTLEGTDLARKYSSWLTRTGLWFAEYKHHWLWLVIAYFAGILSTIFIHWFAAKYIAAGG